MILNDSSGRSKAHVAIFSDMKFLLLREHFFATLKKVRVHGPGLSPPTGKKVAGGTRRPRSTVDMIQRSYSSTSAEEPSQALFCFGSVKRLLMELRRQVSPAKQYLMPDGNEADEGYTVRS